MASYNSKSGVILDQVKKLAQVLHDASSTPSGIYRCVITIWRHLKESLRPQFSFEKDDMVEGLPGVPEQS